LVSAGRRCGKCCGEEHSRGPTPPSRRQRARLIISVIIVGLIIGALGQLVLPGRQDIPIWLTILIGVTGALVGNFLAVILGVRHTAGIDWIRHTLQIAAAAVLIGAFVRFWTRRTPGRRGPYA
jgi:uncharacterized membrane protein YeaQ/YmgE (transglycosylase-associated protein family)